MINAKQAGFFYNLEEGWTFKNCSFHLEKGDILAILGPNGQGKTTLLKTILGVLALKEGCIEASGTIGYVPQNTSPAFPYSVLDMVVMGRARQISMFRSPSRQDFTKAREALAQLGLARFEKRQFSDLSGGQRQLVLIARALAAECDILILDEPASALDFKNQQVILQTVERLSRQRQLTVIFTSHYPQHALHSANKALLMHGAADFQFGSVDDVMCDANLSRLYGMEVRNVAFNHANQSVRTVVPVFSASDQNNASFNQ
ncbi:ABC transporter ATP-binding protein [uncultured Cohaesibacter sp.]|uniref:ABC transporter ATP-binding protein n=1 Tax=uncultured Cohaesibacter sp. TaxID=1002546 RepID=UPI00292D718D|nr:ABC transporter ATP-binding protein [uncultured Cohaesibacter sp.]